jgi:PAS domain S-box-containing protein
MARPAWPLIDDHRPAFTGDAEMNNVNPHFEPESPYRIVDGNDAADVGYPSMTGPVGAGFFNEGIENDRRTPTSHGAFSKRASLFRPFGIFRSHSIGCFPLIALRLIFPAILFAVLCSQSQVFGSTYGKEKTVLYLNSYSVGYAWSDKILEGIREALKGLGVDVQHEQMDTKRILDEKYLNLLLELYAHKFAEKKFDVVICSDDDAFQFLLKHHQRLFPKTPIVFCGVNFFEDSMLRGHEQFTGVLEAFDFESTVLTAVKMFPRKKRVLAITDRVKAGVLNKRIFQELVPRLPGNLEVTLIEDWTIASLKDTLRGSGSDCIVIPLSVFQDKDGNYVSMPDATAELAGSCDAPFFGTWDFLLGHGIVGGRITSGFLQGETAGNLALRILQGEKPSLIPIVKDSPNRLMFDYEGLTRFGIPLEAVPEGAVILNRPSKDYIMSKESFRALLGAMTLLCTAVVLLVAFIGFRSRSARRLQESEERYRSLVDISPDPILMFDPQGGLIAVNRQAAIAYGVESPEQLLAEVGSAFDLLDEANRQKALSNVRSILTEQHVGSIEYTVARKDGTPLQVEINSSAVRRPDGTPWAIISVVRDITERKAAQERLRILGAAVENAGEAIIVTDSSAAIIYVNPTFEETTGYSLKESLGTNPNILSSGTHDGDFYRDMWETIRNGGVWRGRFTNKKKDGTLYQETATISPIKDEEGNIRNFVMVARDVTSEIMLQKQLFHAQKMEAIGTLAGGIAHDVNNLLQAVLGYADLLLMKKGPGDPDRKKLEVIQHAARDGADLVSRILTLGRRKESKARPIDLNDEIRKSERLLRRTMPRMIRIDLLLADDLKIIDGDPAQVEQILLNLGVNAQHAMPDGGRLVIETSNVSLSDEYLRTHLGAKKGKYVLLTVSDTGSGMCTEVLDRIFEPFFTTKANGLGTGLGLAMVHGIVAQHDGYIRCYSEPGRGTSFKIYFPVSAAELATDLTLTREMPALGTETILLVDDDDRVRELGVQIIEMGGYRVLTARSGEEALETYSSHKGEISLVILDLIMPGMGGKRCLEELLRRDPDLKVLIASGYSSNVTAHDEKGMGSRGFISKPYDSKDMFGAIRKVLDEGHL